MTSIALQKQETPIAKFSGFMDKLKPQLALALPKHMNADRMTRLALTAFSTNANLQACSAQSIAGSIMTAAQLGLEPGINGQGYLIPYKTTCTFVPGWKGLVDLVARSGRATVWTGAVYPGDKFEYQLGDSPFCRHIPGDGADENERFTHVYAIGRVKDASMAVIEVWTYAKVQKHLKQYNKVGGRHYAFENDNNFEMYGRKGALLQVLKYMPASIEVANAIEVSHASDAGRSSVIVDGFVSVLDAEQATKPSVETPQRIAQAESASTSANVDQETGEIKLPQQKPAVIYPAGALATDGERKLITTRARNNNLDILDMISSAGLEGLPPDLEGLTKDGFLALRDLLPKAD